MDTQEIRCPSGMRGRIRKILAGDTHELLKGDEEDVSADQLADLAERIWVETIDPGPYQFTGNNPPFRTKVLLGDRSFILLMARIFTSKSKRPVRMQCSGCGRWFTDPDFDYGDLEIKEWPDTAVSEDEWEKKAIEAKEEFAAGAPCRTTMPNGVTVRWKLLTGSMLPEARAFVQQFGGQSLQTEVASRIVDIESVNTSGMDNEARRKAHFDWVCSLPDDRNEFEESGEESHSFWFLWNDIQDKEVGPETDIQKQCQYTDCNFRFGYRTDIMGFIWLPPPKRSGRLRGGNRRTLKSMRGGSV